MQGIMLALFIKKKTKTKHFVQNHEYIYHDSLQAHHIEGVGHCLERIVEEALGMRFMHAKRSFM